MNQPAKRVLVVDDDQYLRQFYSRILSSQGHVPICVGDGAEAMDVLESDPQPYHLAIVDLLLPVQSGWDLIDFMKQNETTAAVPILAVTGLSFSYDEFEAIKKSCDVVLLKGDFEISKFSDTVNRLLAAGGAGEDDTQQI